MNTLIITNDGSPSLMSSKFKESYHSTNGAENESQYVFIDKGLLYKQNYTSLNILEIGFGTGLNTLLTIEHSHLFRNIYYESLEKFPVTKDIYQAFYHSFKNERQSMLKKIHENEWNIEISIKTNFTLQKKHICLQKYSSQKKFDLIYFDAFSPRTQPEMWSKHNLNVMYTLLNKNGSLVTYCAKGEVKRHLKEIGFKVETLPGPPYKREMIRANK